MIFLQFLTILSDLFVGSCSMQEAAVWLWKKGYFEHAIARFWTQIASIANTVIKLIEKYTISCITGLPNIIYILHVVTHNTPPHAWRTIRSLFTYVIPHLVESRYCRTCNTVIAQQDDRWFPCASRVLFCCHWWDYV